MGIVTKEEIMAFVANPSRPLPTISDDGAPFWAGLRSGELRFQRCDSCGRFRHPPRLACPLCGHTGATWQLVDPTGTVYTYTVVHRPPDASFQPYVPYVIAIVDLPPEGVRLIGNVLAVDPGDVRVGMQVSVVIDDITDETSLYHFEPQAG